MNYVEFLDSFKETLGDICQPEEIAEIALCLKTMDPKGEIIWKTPTSVGMRQAVGSYVSARGFNLYWSKSGTFLDLELEMVFNFCGEDAFNYVDISFGPWAAGKGPHRSYRYGMDETQTIVFVNTLKECFEVLN